MTPLELLQLIRTTNAHQVLAELEKTEVMLPETYRLIVGFYERAAQQPKKP